MTRGQTIIQKVKDFFEAIRAKYPKITDNMLDSQGAIYYMNGNDGTDFDWDVNGRCCEFYIFHKNEIGFIKVCVDIDGKINGYVFPNGEMEPTEEMYCWITAEEALYLATILYEKADMEDIYDSIITEIDFSYEPTEQELREMNREYEEVREDREVF